ncbi:type I DNA topoisomerase [Rickettsiales endosymbiont of Peranema trichophorum]|uniref:type I DNA topoisomerase n=1 Tax=Rickettsiales endosymbiont of Peranema trichophorum TaxID=2486577 RepID=UPI0010236B26|nr:type I DNA topoisomerase [Rickettsiales endosymbiont of Peranema trichophorum]RZI47758.1 type I DNA topoisomerase [Rickettsiales endosymbiont of Peranema trichophorum]
MKLLIVESPSKAKTLNKYLGKEFVVLSSYGHIRGLPSAPGSVEPDAQFKMHYEMTDKSGEHVKRIVEQAKKAEMIYLATDPDREGEAISWHISEILRMKKAIQPSTTVKRIVFHEVTKKAILEALSHPKDIDMDLVHAQQARQALDYLVGFTLSPVLWRKLPGSKSAGRVQSVALRLISEREDEIDKFQIQEYWSIDALFASTEKDVQEHFSASLTHYKGQKLEKLSIGGSIQAESMLKDLEHNQYSVIDIQEKETARHPSPPFTTSTLIQEAARKLGFSAKHTSRVAQKLYEGIAIGTEVKGLITYMRTDSVNLAKEAIDSIRREIISLYGNERCAPSPRVYQTKSKNAQEAHEAIRPTDIALKPTSIQSYLDADQYKLYELIWKRTIACQMSSAKVNITTILISDQNNTGTFKATGSVVIFDGFYKVYQEGKDEADDEVKDRLPVLHKYEALNTLSMKANQHMTQPPPRYTEASLIKKLEELDIGRPSTYSSIISILQSRNYVALEKKRFIPEVRGRIVTAFLTLYFTKYVEYHFTANLEESLDNVANGQKDWRALLEDFWSDFHLKTKEVMTFDNQGIVTNLESHLQHFLFPPTNPSTDDQTAPTTSCPKCKTGRLHLKMGKFGAFLGCDNYPTCTYAKNLDTTNTDNATSESVKESKLICVEEKSGKQILLKNGPYGYYLQFGEDATKKGTKKDSLVRRVSLPKFLKPEDVTTDIAKSLLELPKILGKDSVTGQNIVLGIGKFGPYLECNKQYTSLRQMNIFEIDLNQAISLIAESAKKKKPAKKSK